MTQHWYQSVLISEQCWALMTSMTAKAWTSWSIHTILQPREASQDLFQKGQIAVLKKLGVAQENRAVAAFQDMLGCHSPLAWAASRHLERPGPFPAKGRPGLLLPAQGLGCSDRNRDGGSRVALAAMETGSHYRWWPGCPSTVPTPCIPWGGAQRPHTLGRCGTGGTGLCFRNKYPPGIWLFSESKQRK